MERATVMKTFHGSLIQKPCNLRERAASFSSYLRPAEASDCQQHLTVGHGQCATLDDDSTTEISIFDAHKYFNELNNNDTQKVMIGSNSRVSPLVNLNGEHSSDRCDISSIPRRHSSASSSVDGSYASIRNHRTRSFHAATPTASSEASWNSQTGLLSHPPGTVAVSIRNPPHPHGQKNKSKGSMSKPRWLFGRRCPCSGKKSVQVEEIPKTSEPKTPTPPQPRLSQNQIAGASLNINSQDHPNINPKTSMENFPLNLETGPNKPDPNNILIKPNNWVNQRHPQQQQIITTNCHKLSPAETHFPATLQSQSVLASGKHFIDHAAGFTFPILNPPSTTSSSSPSMKLQVLNGVDEDPPRDSLEVFRPLDIEPNSVSMKPIDKDHQNFTYPASPKSRIIDDDVASDASSDLFEIESFSTQTTPTFPVSYRRRDSLDEASNFDARRLSTNNGFFYGRRSLDESMTPTITEGYEPSEASIDWSVTTAEGFDRASIPNFSVPASEIADDVTMIRRLNGNGCDQITEKGKRKSSSGNGLLSCRCEKAVNVGPQPVKFVPVAEEQRGTTPFHPPGM